MENCCKGITKSGGRCKIKRGLVNGYCRLHIGQYKPETAGQAGDTDNTRRQQGKVRAKNSATAIRKNLAAISLVCTVMITYAVYFFFRKGKK